MFLRTPGERLCFDLTGNPNPEAIATVRYLRLQHQERDNTNNHKSHSLESFLNHSEVKNSIVL